MKKYEFSFYYDNWACCPDIICACGMPQGCPGTGLMRKSGDTFEKVPMQDWFATLPNGTLERNKGLVECPYCGMAYELSKNLKVYPWYYRLRYYASFLKLWLQCYFKK